MVQVVNLADSEEREVNDEADAKRFEKGEQQKPGPRPLLWRRGIRAEVECPRESLCNAIEELDHGSWAKA